VNGVDTTIVLLPSVLLGASSVLPLAASLKEFGRTVDLADTAGATTPGEVAARYRKATPGTKATWVAHSNAGLYLPAILRDRPGDIGIFVDASVPCDAPPHVSASGMRLRALENLGDGSGLLTAWVDWWSDEQLTELLPDAGQRRLLRKASPRLPLSYFTAEVDVPDDWSEVPAAYVSFNGGYVRDRERMAKEGRPTRHVTGGHLNILTRPRDVAVAILDLESSLRELDGRT
jgi:hypothetical protein